MLLWLMNIDFAGGGNVVEATADTKQVLFLADVGKLMGL